MDIFGTKGDTILLPPSDLFIYTLNNITAFRLLILTATNTIMKSQNILLHRNSLSEKSYT